MPPRSRTGPGRSFRVVASLWLLAIVIASYASNPDYWWYGWKLRNAVIEYSSLWARPLSTIGAGLALGLSCLLAGLTSRTVRQLGEEDPPLALAIAFSIGAAAIGLAAYLIAGSFGLSRGNAGALLLTPAAAGLAVARGEAVDLVRRYATAPWRGGWLGLLSVGFIAVLLAGSLAPDRGSDSVGQHLPFSWWLAHGGRPWTPNPYLVSYYPNLVHALQAVAFAIAGPSGASAVNPLFLLASLPLVVRIARRLSPEGKGGEPARLLFLATVPVGIYTTKAYLDVPLTTFVAGAVLFAQAWSTEGRPRDAVLSLLLSAFAVATKPHGIPLYCLVFLGLLAARRGEWRWLVAGVAVGLPWILPWPIRNTILVGNPLHPFLTETPLQEAGQQPSWIDLLKLPWHLAFEERSLMLPASGGVHLALLPFWFLVARSRRGLVLLGLTSVFVAFCYSTWPNPRYLLPALAVLSAYSGIGLTWFFEHSRATRLAGAATLAVVAAVSGAVFLAGNYRWDHRGLKDSLGVTLGLETPDDYLAREFPAYGAITFVNGELPADSVVLLEYGIFPYVYLERPVVVVHFWAQARPEVEPEAFDAFLERHRATHVFRFDDPSYDSLVPSWRTRRYGRELFREGKFVVQEVVPVER